MRPTHKMALRANHQDRRAEWSGLHDRSSLQSSSDWFVDEYDAPQRYVSRRYQRDSSLIFVKAPSAAVPRDASSLSTIGV
jgi:hypothetical protein